MSDTKQHGGKRPNSGHKPLFIEPTRTLSIRVPASKYNLIKKIIKKYLEQWKL